MPLKSKHSGSGMINACFPRKMPPMRLSRRIEPFDSDQFIFELKVDSFLERPEAAWRLREDRNGESFHHPLCRSFDLDRRTCSMHKPTAPAMTPNRNRNNPFTTRDLSQGKSSENNAAIELTIIKSNPILISRLRST